MPDSCKYDMRLDFLVGDPLKFGFDKIEEIAEHFHQFLVKEGVTNNLGYGQEDKQENR